ncbi:hypothetical protein CLU96_1247 [Chryseobacterium sp. 52]|uniref:hypothetical protein n=1 Tax=Chryseobacterium sp. 52 TaxID=2035213 RepID=UPI000C17E51A|nr:hypothetical protein [Chryseobacterium sp. 52]PIF44306.1 hypothetical protein CLU96_1247 [Chryseobacterium sp. 52]
MFWTQDEINRVLDKVIELFLLPRFDELGMEATGEWRENVTYTSDLDSGTIWGRQYSEQLAQGLPPGNMVPIPALKKWAKAKFGLSDAAALSAAFAVRDKIFKKGTTWYEQGGSTLIEVLQEPRTIQFIQDELSVIAQARLADELIRNAQEVFS